MQESDKFIPDGTLARRLRDLMQEQGLSIRSLAAKLKVSYEYTRRIMNGETVPSRATLSLLSTELELPFEELEKLAAWDKLRRKHGSLFVELTGQDLELQAIQMVWEDLNAQHKDDLMRIAQLWQGRTGLKRR